MSVYLPRAWKEAERGGRKKKKKTTRAHLITPYHTQSEDTTHTLITDSKGEGRALHSTKVMAPFQILVTSAIRICSNVHRHTQRTAYLRWDQTPGHPAHRDNALLLSAALPLRKKPQESSDINARILMNIRTWWYPKRYSPIRTVADFIFGEYQLPLWDHTDGIWSSCHLRLWRQICIIFGKIIERTSLAVHITHFHSFGKLTCFVM